MCLSKLKILGDNDFSENNIENNLSFSYVAVYMVEKIYQDVGIQKQCYS